MSDEPKIPYDEILSCVRQRSDPRRALGELRSVGQKHMESPLWDGVNTPDCAADVEAAAEWLNRNLAKDCPPGVYLGLDTCNERDGSGKNIEIGMTDQVDPKRDDLEWIFDGLDYGDNHLIRGLYEIHKGYESFGLDESKSLLPDYIFFMGYSGVVLAAAIEKLNWRWKALYVWGFHSGDLALLARTSHKGIERLAVYPTE